MTSYYCGNTRQQCDADWPSAVVAPTEAPAYMLGCVLVFHQCWTYQQLPRVSRGKALIALHRAGLLPAVEASMAEADFETTVWYNEAEWERTHQCVISMGNMLGLTPQQVDSLFMQAS